MTRLAVIVYLRLRMAIDAEVHGYLNQRPDRRLVGIGNVSMTLGAFEFSQDDMPAMRIINMFREMKELPEDHGLPALHFLQEILLLGIFR